MRRGSRIKECDVYRRTRRGVLLCELPEGHSGQHYDSHYDVEWSPPGRKPRQSGCNYASPPLEQWQLSS